MRMLAHDTRNQRNTRPQQAMRNAVYRNRIKTRIGQNDFHLAARGWIAFIPGQHILAKHVANVPGRCKKRFDHRPCTHLAIVLAGIVAPGTRLVLAFVHKRTKDHILQGKRCRGNAMAALGNVALGRHGRIAPRRTEREQKRYEMIHDGMNRR